MKINNFFKFSLTGLICGMINGMLGSGGGVISVMLLSYYLHLDNKKAHATTILVILPLCIMSSVIFIKNGYYDLNLVLKVGIGSIIGGIIGAKLLAKLSNRCIHYIFGSVLIISAVRMMFR
ncbi:MAG: sulfite exporter TauE/SafE family protein [Eubacteriales bacterium]